MFYPYVYALTICGIGIVFTQLTLKEPGVHLFATFHLLSLPSGSPDLGGPHGQDGGEDEHSPHHLPVARQVVEEEHLEGEGDEDVEGVLDEAHHVRLLQLQRQDVDHLLAEQGLEHRGNTVCKDQKNQLIYKV